MNTSTYKSVGVHCKAKAAEQDAAQVCLDALNNTEPASMKDQLRQFCRVQGLGVPRFEGIHNDDNSTYTAMVTINNKEHYGVSFPTKKMAEDHVSEVALAWYKRVVTSD